MEGEVKGKTFKMKGHTLPGINQRSDAKAKNVAEQGLAGSSAFQQTFGQPPIVDPMAQGNPMVTGGGTMGGVGAGPGLTPPLTPPIVSKPSMAKIYNKSELTKEVLGSAVKKIIPTSSKKLEAPKTPPKMGFMKTFKQLEPKLTKVPTIPPKKLKV